MAVGPHRNFLVDVDDKNLLLLRIKICAQAGIAMLMPGRTYARASKIFYFSDEFV
jgi:hypothetical protein